MNLKLTFMTIAVFILTILSFGIVFFVPRNYVGDSIVDQDKIYYNNFQQAFLLTASEPNYFPLRKFNIPDPSILAKSAVLLDSKSQKILFQKDMHRPLPIASLTKLMTAVVIIENLDLSTVISVSVEDLNADGYGADLIRGEKIKASELLKMMLIKSSNDAALAFTREMKVRGVDLVVEMNKKASELGMLNTHFEDPAGLNDGALSTAQDLLKLAQYVGKHRLIWQILSIPETDIASTDGKISHHLVNTDKLLGQISGIIGGKTGFTERAMGTMILLVDADDGNSDLVGVVLGSNDRFSDIKQLIEWGRSAHRWK